MKGVRPVLMVSTVCLAQGFFNGVMAGEVFVVPAPPMTGDYVTSTPVSESGITPYFIFQEREEDADRGGHRDCKDVRLAFFDNLDHYEASSDRVSYDERGSPRFNPADGPPVSFPEWLAVDYDPEDQCLVWEAIGPHRIGAVIVKGGMRPTSMSMIRSRMGTTGWVCRKTAMMHRRV